VRSGGAFTVRGRLDESRHTPRLSVDLRALPPRPVRTPLKSLLEQLLLAALRKLVGETAPTAVTVERTRDAGHGDYASNIALKLAKAAGKNPPDMARAIVEALPASPLVSRAEVAGPGFINFVLAPEALAREIRRIHELGDAYGRSSVSAECEVLMQSHDLQLATSHTNENPLYDVQYVHARAASAMKEVKARGISFDRAAALDKLELLDKETERALIAVLLRFPEEVESAAANCAPHSIVYYLRDVANAFNTYYNTEKWFVAEDDLRSARLALVLAAGQVVHNGLGLIGVSAPESM
jgi:arginyl-tRNA synthetase